MCNAPTAEALTAGVNSLRIKAACVKTLAQRRSISRTAAMRKPAKVRTANVPSGRRKVVNASRAARRESMP